MNLLSGLLPYGYLPSYAIDTHSNAFIVLKFFFKRIKTELSRSLFFLIYFNLIFKLYIIVLVLPNIKMNLPQVYMCIQVYRYTGIKRSPLNRCNDQSLTDRTELNSRFLLLWIWKAYSTLSA